MNSMLIRIGFVCTSLFLVACQSEIETPVQEVQSSTYVDEKDSSLAANSLETIEEKSSLSSGGWENEEARKLSFAGVKDPQKLRDFFSNIRGLAKNDDREGIAELIFYPFNTYEPKGGVIKKTYKSKSEFLRDYDMIVTPAAQLVLENANYDDFFSNWRGGAVAHGAMWFNTFEGELKITKLSG